jgi:hypothetical protein
MGWDFKHFLSMKKISKKYNYLTFSMEFIKHFDAILKRNLIRKLKDDIYLTRSIHVVYSSSSLLLLELHDRA